MIDFDSLVLGPIMDTFGEEAPITFTPATGDPVENLPGVFNAAYVHVRLEGGVPVTATNPTLGCRASAFPGNLPVQEDGFTIRGTEYRVVDVNPDGEGHLLIQLMVAPP